MALPSALKIMRSILKFLQRMTLLLVAVVLCAACQSLPAVGTLTWEPVTLPTEASPLDVDFVSADHGWLVGSESTLLETFDGGKSWEPRSLELGDSEYRLTSVSFSGDEGWIVGEPTLLLHTTDGGKSWSKIGLSAKLPGTPKVITALGPSSVEMATDQGAVYESNDGAQHWDAKVIESVGITRNIRRSPGGQYVAVSERGNYYSIWQPGMRAWEPYNRNDSRKLQRMGFDPDNQLWMLSRGGQIQLSKGTPFGGQEEWSDPIRPNSGGIGLLDLAYRTPNEVWASGGSGTLLRSTDGGATWEQDKTVDQIPSSLFKVIFVSPERGFITGQSGVLLRYIGGNSQTA
jgi:photosystem II stability/assembly factor-like uncharacterized protein